MRHLTDDIVLSVKDAMRNLRYTIRSEAEAALSRAAGDAEPGAASSRLEPRDVRRRNRVARLVDKLFTEVESGTLALVSPQRDKAQSLAFPRPIEDYFAGHPNRDEAAELLFARSFYRAAKNLLRGFRLTNMLIFEQAIGRARDDVLERHGELVRRLRGSIEAAPEGDKADRVLLCAALTASLVAARPIKEAGAQAGSVPRDLVTHPNAYCFLVLGLATAIASVAEEEASSRQEMVDSAASVVDLRFQRFAEALEADDPAERLAREFDEVLPFLP
jgi:hypothetical protein